MNFRGRLGFEYLPPQEQQAYKVMLKAFSSMAVSVNCSQINRDVDLMKVMKTVLGDNPFIVYFGKSTIEIQTSGFERQQFFLTDVQSKPQAEKMRAALDATANKIVSLVRGKAKSNDEYSLLINLYEFLQKDIRYDYEEYQITLGEKSVNPTAHNAYGAIINKLAVCDGFSLGFSLLAQKLGFECMLVTGPSGNDTELHAWNIIKIRNRFYHFDITWDANDSDEFSYNYFAVTDKEIARCEHNWDKATTPVCSSSDFSYYSKNGLYVSNTKELSDIIKAFGKKSANVFRIKLARSIKLPDNAEDYLIQMVLKEAAKPGMRTQASCNWNENTRCFFAKVLYKERGC